MKNEDILEYNKKAWDKQVELGKSEWTIPVTPEEIDRAKKGDIRLLLTPSNFVPLKWYPELKGSNVLCLASGGGQQGPILAAAGANVTVLDNSPKQLERDDMVAKREGLKIKTVQGDMKDLSGSPDEYFDLIFHPVSNIFAPDILPVWKEAGRVTKMGGILLAGLVNPVIYLFDQFKMSKGQLEVAHKIPYSPFNPDAKKITDFIIKYEEPLEYGHTLEDQIGGQTRAGFVIDDMFEDKGVGNSRTALDEYISYFIATRAIKTKNI